MPMRAAACYWTFSKRGAEWSIIHDAGEEARAASEGVHGSTTTPETENHIWSLALCKGSCQFWNGEVAAIYPYMDAPTVRK